MKQADLFFVRELTRRLQSQPNWAGDRGYVRLLDRHMPTLFVPALGDPKQRQLITAVVRGVSEELRAKRV